MLKLPPQSQTEVTNQHVDLAKLRSAMPPSHVGPIVPHDLTSVRRVSAKTRGQLAERRVATQCLSDLSVSMSHFNYASDLFR